MLKRCRVPRDNLLGALEEEEIVLDTQPELFNTNPSEFEEGRKTKKQKRDHYRLGRSLNVYILPIAGGLARKRRSYGCAYAVNSSQENERGQYLVFFVTAREEVLRDQRHRVGTQRPV
jgi:hypothetical protein